MQHEVPKFVEAINRANPAASAEQQEEERKS
jgi:hypothetical protein